MFRLAFRTTAAAMFAAVLLSGCTTAVQPEPTPTEPAYTGIPVWNGWEPSIESSDLVLESTDFESEGEFPESIRLVAKCHGTNIRPELHWSGAPEGTESYIITFSYEKTPEQRWLAFDIPADTTDLPASGDAPAVGAVGLTSRNTVDFFGPCSLAGEKFRLWFTVYALDTTLGLASGAAAGDVREAAIGHVLAAAELGGYLTGPAK